MKYVAITIVTLVLAFSPVTAQNCGGLAVSLA